MDDNSKKLRELAKEQLRQGNAIDTSLYETDLKVLVEELSIYQIELEHQNNELMLSQEHLQQSNDRYIDLFDNAPIGYLIVDSLGLIKDINHTACVLLKSKKQEFIGTKISKYIHPDYQDIYYLYFQTLIKQNLKQPCDIKFWKANKSYFYARIHGSRQNQDELHEEQEFRLAIIDVSVQKEMELKLLLETEKANESERLKSMFLANMSHEIRTPLNGILGFASLLYEDEIDFDNVKKYSEIIYRNGERLLDLINKILDISKIEAGSMQLIETTFFPVEVIDEMIELYMPLATKKGLTITKNMADNVGNLQIVADKNKLIQILSNLLSNAVKYTKTGSIEIGCSYSLGHIRFKVSDTGIGISNESIVRMFERFYQANTNTHYNTEGSGLGLSLSKALVELMGGKIEVESELGSGSKFSFAIPCDFLVNSQNNKPEVFHNDQLKDNEILLVEDDLEQIKLLKVLLDKFNIKTVIAHNGVEAIKIIQKSPDIKVVFMDINLPEMNGFDATREIRKLDPNIPIIALTGHSSIFQLNDALYVGCSDYYIKPLKREHISKIVKKYIL
jgi:PAS domain S-box-containing protein